MLHTTGVFVSDHSGARLMLQDCMPSYWRRRPKWAQAKGVCWFWDEGRESGWAAAGVIADIRAMRLWFRRKTSWVDLVLLGFDVGQQVAAHTDGDRLLCVVLE